MYGISNASDKVYFYFGVGFGQSICPEKKIVYIDRSPNVFIVSPVYPVYYYPPYERIVIIHKHKPRHWEKHHHWDW